VQKGGAGLFIENGKTVRRNVVFDFPFPFQPLKIARASTRMRPPAPEEP
jgi:hypothetical protein